MRHGRIRVAVDREHGYLADAPRLVMIATAAHGHAGGKQVRAAAERVPRTVPSHGESSHVHARGIDVLRADRALHEFQRQPHRDGRLRRHRVRTCRPVNLHPLAPVWTLGSQQADALALPREEVEDRSDRVLQLRGVVAPPLARSMEK